MFVGRFLYCFLLLHPNRVFFSRSLLLKAFARRRWWHTQRVRKGERKSTSKSPVNRIITFAKYFISHQLECWSYGDNKKRISSRKNRVGARMTSSNRRIFFTRSVFLKSQTNCTVRDPSFTCFSHLNEEFENNLAFQVEI